jgi:hypothetical protein
MNTQFNLHKTSEVFSNSSEFILGPLLPFAKLLEKIDISSVGFAASKTKNKEGCSHPSV